MVRKKGLFQIPLLIALISSSFNKQSRFFTIASSKICSSFALPSSSKRALAAEPPIIEIILNKYAHLGCENLAQGVSRWGPPEHVLTKIEDKEERNHRYGPILGDPSLVAALEAKLSSTNNLDLSNQEIMVTGGGNQAFANVAFALCDPGDQVAVIRPYYFSHLVALQLAGADVKFGDFDEETLLPDLCHLKSLLDSGCRMVVLTSPNNPSGAVVPPDMIKEIVEMCRQACAWLVFDEAYEDFMFDGAEHLSPCANKLGYDGIIHLFTMSKIYGMAGWRVGYMVYPKRISDSMQKVQDTIPTHACIKSQAIARACLEFSEKYKLGHDGETWEASRVGGLARCRAAAWAALAPLGTRTARARGAFYFLARLPPGSDDTEAVGFLAENHGVMVLPGSAFGAPGHLRISYGSLPEARCLAALGQLKEGLKALQKRSGSSAGVVQDTGGGKS